MFENPLMSGPGYGGMSGYPTYIGMEPSQFMSINPAMAKYTSEAMRTGPSSGTRFALAQNAKLTTEGRDSARRMAGGMAKNAEANLAMHGGMGAGAKERIQKNATNSALDFENAADAAGGKNRIQLMASDEANRVSGLGNAANMNEQANLNRYNMKAADADKRNAFNMNFYNQQMGAWAANQQANATANSGKK